MKLISWNVNGVRAALGKGFEDFLKVTRPDVMCLQEVKAHREQVEWAAPKAYEVFWHSAEKKGYSGTACLARSPVQSYEAGFGKDYLDGEGRVQTLEFADFFLINVYAPNAQPELTRLKFKAEEWWPALVKKIRRLRIKKPVILCGDLNVAHMPIDLARPKPNEGAAGYTAEERAIMDGLLGSGLVDIFRRHHPDEPGHYTWWSFRGGARERNVGWRIDYFLVDERLCHRIKKAKIFPDILGSDHCPISIELAPA